VLNAFQTTDRRSSLFRRTQESTPWNSADDGTQLGITFIEVDAQQPQRLFSAGDVGIRRSDDGGATWTTVNSSVPIAYKVHPRNSNYQARVTSSHYVEFSQDGGITWQNPTIATIEDPRFILTAPIFSGPTTDLICPDITQEGAFFVVGSIPSAAVLRFNAKALTRDILATSGFPFGFVGQTTDGTLFYGGGLNGNLMVRLRNGTSTGIPAPASVLTLAPSNPNVIYAVNSRVPSLSRSADAGDSWQLQSYPCRKQSVFFPTSVFYVDPQSENTLYAACYEGGFYRSTDGGQTWPAFDDGLLAGNIRAIKKDGTGTLWAGGPKYTNSFLIRISADAKILLSSSILGGAGGALITSILTDGTGNLVLGGYTGFSADFPDTGVSSANTFAPGFLMRLSPDAASIAVSRRLNFYAYAATQDSLGRLQLAGATDATFAVTADAEQPDSGGVADAFWAVISSDFRQILHATFLGGSNDDIGYSVHVLPDGRTMLAGYTYSQNFPVTADAAQPVSVPSTTSPFVTIALPVSSRRARGQITSE
jgi:photosystem II stability/assembly factor-like uncharacterized protein